MRTNSWSFSDDGSCGAVANDNRPAGSDAHRTSAHGAAWSTMAYRHASALPDDAVAVIRPTQRTVVTSGTAGAGEWLLTFKPRSAPFPDPLMGWTMTRDTLQQVRLRFGTVQAAIDYCRRHGLDYELQSSSAATVGRRREPAVPATVADPWEGALAA